jgi:hypothetical protein
LHCSGVKQIHATAICGRDQFISVSGDFSMRILWGALRAVSVEAMGVLLVLWMLHGATGLAIDAPWRATSSPSSADAAADTTPSEASHPLLAWNSGNSTDAASQATSANDEPEVRERATLRQWFNTLFPAKVANTPAQPEIEHRADYTAERLDHFSQLYGIASRD